MFFLFGRNVRVQFNVSCIFQAGRRIVLFVVTLNSQKKCLAGCEILKLPLCHILQTHAH